MIYPVKVKKFSELDLGLLDTYEGPEELKNFISDSLDRLNSKPSINDYDKLTIQFYNILDKYSSKLDDYDKGDVMYIWLAIGWSIYKMKKFTYYPIFKCVNYLKYWRPTPSQLKWMKSYDSDVMKVRSQRDIDMLERKYSDYFTNDPESILNNPSYPEVLDKFIFNDLPYNYK